MDRKRYKLVKENFELAKLIPEIEKSISLVKEQINALTVETLHLKYLLVVQNHLESESSRPKKPKLDELNLSIKQETRPSEVVEEEDSD